MLQACLYIDLKVMSDMKVFDKSRYKDRQVIVSLRVKIFLKMEDLVKKKAWNLNNFKAARESMKAMKRNWTTVEVSLRAVTKYTYIKTQGSLSIT